MRSCFRSLLLIAAICIAHSVVTAGDVDSAKAKRALDDVFAAKDQKARDKIIRKLDGTMTAAVAAEARAYAMQLQRRAPEKLPVREEVHLGAVDWEYEVKTRKTTYKNFAMMDLPRGITAEEPVPLVIALHSDLGTAWRELQGLRSAMSTIPDHPMRDCIIACPNALNRGNTADDPRKNPPGEKEYFGWGPKRAGVDTVFNLLDELIANYNIDRDRIYLVGGPGMGTEAAFHLAMLRPSQFAAICVRDGLPPATYEGLDDEEVEALREERKLGEHTPEFPWLKCYRNTPTFWVHADGDTKYPTTQARQAVKEMKAADVPVEFSDYEGFHASGPSSLIAKALKSCVETTRTVPTTVTMKPVEETKGSYGNGRNYWLEITKNNGGEVTVTVSREDNSVTVTGNDVDEITIYLHDDILYLDREVTLIVNGNERAVRPKRELKVLASSASGFAAVGKAYVAVLKVST